MLQVKDLTQDYLNEPVQPLLEKYYHTSSLPSGLTKIPISQIALYSAADAAILCVTTLHFRCISLHLHYICMLHTRHILVARNNWHVYISKEERVTLHGQENMTQMHFESNTEREHLWTEVMLTFCDQASAASLVFKEVLFCDANQDTCQSFLGNKFQGGANQCFQN